MPSMDEQGLLTTLHPIGRSALHEVVLAQMLAAIRAGRLGQGDRLRDSEIADRLGLSRGIVREAIRRLEQEGLVVTQPHRGAFITRPTPEDAAEIFSLRRLLEAYAVRLAVPRVTETDAHLDDMATAVEQMVAAARTRDRSEHMQADLRFHELLCLLSGHRHLHKVWLGLSLKLWLVNFGAQTPYGSDAVERASAHLELIQLLRGRQAEAAVTWIETHLERRQHKVVGGLVAQQTG